VRRQIQPYSEHGHPHRTERDQPIFNLAAGKIAGRNASQSDSDRDGGLQVAGLLIVDSQCVMAVDHDDGLQQRGEKKQVSVPKNGPTENAIGRDLPHLCP